jgi:co-chaperonin GroES (HSP10)
MKITPMFDTITVRPIDVDRITRDGLHLPEDSKLDMMIARVVAVGPGTPQSDGSRRPMDVEPGDVVLLHPNNPCIPLAHSPLAFIKGGEVHDDIPSLVLVKCYDVLGKVEGAPVLETA